MSTWYNAQVHGGEPDFRIQFQTDNYTLFKMVEKACQDAVDTVNAINSEERT